MRTEQIFRARVLMIVVVVFLTSGFLVGCADYEATALAVSRAIAYQDKSDALVRRFEEVEAVFRQRGGWYKEHNLEVDNLWAWAVRDRRESSYDLYQTWYAQADKLNDIYLDFTRLSLPPAYQTYQQYTEEWMEVVITRRLHATYYIREYLLFTEEVTYEPGKVTTISSMTIDEVFTALTTGTNKSPDEESIEKLAEYRERQLEATRIFDELQPTESRFEVRAEQERRKVFQ